VPTPEKGCAAVSCANAALRIDFRERKIMENTVSETQQCYAITFASKSGNGHP
jgi:hypothetical protein